MKIDNDNINFEDVENTITYSLSAKNLENNLNKREEKLCDKITDLEAKLAESERKNFELLTKLNLKEYAPAFCTLADRECEALGQVKKLKQQLAEKETHVKKLNNEAQKYFEDAYCNDFHKQDKISFAIEQLEQIRKEFEIKFKGCKWEDKMLVGKFCNITNETIDNQINVLRNNKDGIH